MSSASRPSRSPASYRGLISMPSGDCHGSSPLGRLVRARSAARRETVRAASRPAAARRSSSGPSSTAPPWSGSGSRSRRPRRAGVVGDLEELGGRAGRCPGDDHPTRAGRAQGRGGRLRPTRRRPRRCRPGRRRAGRRTPPPGRRPRRWRRRRRRRHLRRPAGWWRTRRARCGPRPGRASPGRRGPTAGRHAAPRTRRRSDARRRPRPPDRAGSRARFGNSLSPVIGRVRVATSPVALGRDVRDQGRQVRALVRAGRTAPRPRRRGRR